MLELSLHLKYKADYHTTLERGDGRGGGGSEGIQKEGWVLLDNNDQQ